MSVRLIAAALTVATGLWGVLAWRSHLISTGDTQGAARVQAAWDAQENERNAVTSRDNATKFRNAERTAHEDAKREAARLARDAAAASVVRGLRDEITRLNSAPIPTQQETPALPPALAKPPPPASFSEKAAARIKSWHQRLTSSETR